MATRLYFHAHTSGNPILTPAFDAVWDNTSSAVRRSLVTAAASANGGDLLITKPAVSGPYNVLIAQFCLPGLAAQTITGDVKGQARFDISSVAGDASVQTVIRVWDPATSTFRGTLLSAHSSAPNLVAGTEGYEIVATSENRKVPSGWSGTGAALSSLAVQSGDWLVVEIGGFFTDPSVVTRTINMHQELTYGVTELPEDETTTSDNLPWLEFSSTLTFNHVIKVARGDGAGAVTRRTVPIRHAVSPAGAAVPTAGQVWPRGAGQ